MTSVTMHLVALSTLALVACGGDAPPPAAPAHTEVRATDPPGSRFRWTCKIDISHGGQEDAMFVGVNDDGASFAIAIGPAESGPFELEKKNKTFKTVVEGDRLTTDEDLRILFKSESVDVAAVAKLTVYGIELGGAWSVGVAVASDRAGKDVAKFGWTMRPAHGRRC